MSKWVELKHSEGNIIVDFEKVFEIYIEYKKSTDRYYIVLVTIDRNDKAYINCESELEAQMIYAKLKKFLVDSECLKEIQL